MRAKRAYHVIFGLSLIGLTALGAWWVVFFKRSVDLERAAAIDELRSGAALAAFHIGHGTSPPAPGPIPGELPLELVEVDALGAADIIQRRVTPNFPGFAVRPTAAAMLELDDKVRRRWAMVVGEGGLLFLLIGVCTFMLYRLVRQERRYARRMEEFLNAVTHEMKTPLAGIKSLLQTLAAGKVPAGQEAALFSMGLKEVERLDHLVENVLISGRLRAEVFEVQLEPVPLRPLLEQFVAHRQGYLVDRPDAIRLVCEPSGTNAVAAADASALRVVLENLTDNAFKYGGKAPEVILRTHRTGEQLAISVEDQGVGFEPARAEELFLPFRRVLAGETTVKHGTGLGLSLARNLARRMGGELTAASDGIDRGSRFTVTLKEAR